MSQGKNEKALEYYEESLLIQENVRGKESIACTATFNQIGRVY